jgi:hypothetical protein
MCTTSQGYLPDFIFVPTIAGRSCDEALAPAAAAQHDGRGDGWRNLSRRQHGRRPCKHGGRELPWWHGGRELPWWHGGRRPSRRPRPPHGAVNEMKLCLSHCSGPSKRRLGLRVGKPLWCSACVSCVVVVVVSYVAPCCL